MVRLGLVAVVLGLAGCASQPGAPLSQPAAWQHWQCEGGEQFRWRFADETNEVVELRLDALAFTLPRQPSGSGMLYSDATLVFHAKGDEALLYWAADDELIGRGCRAAQGVGQ